jgi:DNA-binding PadR family transcriptional regulator
MLTRTQLSPGAQPRPIGGRSRSLRLTTELVKFEHSCCTGAMNPTRLFILGALAKHGPMYGHQLRRDARLDRTEMWSEVRPGSLYGALHRLAAEGLIEPLRTEQDGQLPARTVYGITAEGLRELRALRAEALQAVRVQPDPVDLALAMSGDVAEDTLRGYFDDRIRALSAQAAEFDHQRERAWPDQTVADDLVVEHARLRIQAELSWHQQVLDQLGKLTADSEQRDTR